MVEETFQKIIEESRKEGQEIGWSGTCLDYLGLVKQNPDIAQLAPGRVYNRIMQEGTQEIDNEMRLPNYEDIVRYKFFKDDLFGLDESLHDIMRFFKAGARRTETGKRILILVGPVSSGKSTIANKLKAGLEKDLTRLTPSKDARFMKNLCISSPMPKDPSGRPVLKEFLRKEKPLWTPTGTQSSSV